MLHTKTLQAFRRLYEEVGLGWVYAITKYEPVSLHIHCIGMFISETWVYQEKLLVIPSCSFFFHFFFFKWEAWYLQIAKIADFVYSVWAKYRLQITGKFMHYKEFSH